MITKFPNDPIEICGLLADASRDVYSSLIEGSLKVREYFDSLKHQVNAPLAANIARYHAKHTIAKNRNIRTPYYLEEVPNNGIAIKQDLFEIKVLKGRDGDPPSPSKSKKSERFYSHYALQLPLFKNLHRPWASHEWKEFVESTDKLCLIYCWEVDESYSITRLQLMCPRQPWKYMQAVKLFWKEDIPNPLTGLVNLPNVNENEEELEDLEIYFDETGELES
jgi:hypothetical protein